MGLMSLFSPKMPFLPIDTRVGTIYVEIGPELLWIEKHSCSNQYIPLVLSVAVPCWFQFGSIEVPSGSSVLRYLAPREPAFAGFRLSSSEEPVGKRNSTSGLP